MWQELIDVLNELNKTYGAARILAEKKHKVLVSTDMKALEEIVKEERKTASEVQQLEVRRKDILRKLAEDVPQVAADMKLKELAKLAPNKQFTLVLEKLHAALGENVAKVKELGENNQILIEAAMQAVNYHLNRLGGTVAAPTYGGGGKENSILQKNMEIKA